MPTCKYIQRNLVTLSEGERIIWRDPLYSQTFGHDDSERAQPSAAPAQFPLPNVTRNAEFSVAGF